MAAAVNMLSLLPALFLLAFQGPAALERIGHEGRLPEALRALERAFAGPDSSATEAGTDAGHIADPQMREAYFRLAGLTSSAAISAAIAELFRAESPAFGQTGSNPPLVRETQRSSPVDVDEPGRGASEGYTENRRSRDGPVA